MTDKELREIRRRFRPDKNNIMTITGCIVNSERNIVANFNQALSTTSTEETERLLSTMKKSIASKLRCTLW